MIAYVILPQDVVDDIEAFASESEATTSKSKMEHGPRKGESLIIYTVM